MINRKKLFALLLCGSILSLSVTLTGIVDGGVDYQHKGDIQYGQTSHPPFNITHNANFSDFGFLGSGTEEDPYIIEGIQIVDDGLCISIANTTAYFEIRDSIFNGENTGDGIRIDNVTHATISNCSFMDCNDGLEAWTMNYSAVQGCTFQNNSMALAAFVIMDSIFSDNQVDESDRGFLLGYSQNSRISSNTIENSKFSGIELLGIGKNSTIEGNIVDRVEPPEHWFDAAALSVSFFAQNWTIRGNTLKNANPCVRTSSEEGGNVFLNNHLQTSGVAIRNEWMTAGDIFDSNIIDAKIGGIYLGNCEDYIIRNNEFRSVEFYDIYLSNSVGFVVENNSMRRGIQILGTAPSSWNHEFSDNKLPGGEILYLNAEQDRHVDGSNISQLVIANCQNITVSGANLKKTTMGGTIAYSTDCTIENSTIMNNTHGGLFLTRTENILIDDNRIWGNGYYPYAQVGGILVQYADRTNITRNIIYNNSKHGIEFYQSDGCLVYNNWISNNTGYGIRFHSGTGNRIFGNAIGWNEEGNAVDAGQNNNWDNEIDLGNWWSNYNGTGAYEIEGPAGSKDNYPMELMDPSIKIPIGPEPNYILIGAIAAVVTVAILGVLVVLLRRKGKI